LIATAIPVLSGEVMLALSLMLVVLAWPALQRERVGVGRRAR
jgi:hypothetical protein